MSVQLQAKYNILIIRSAQFEAEKVQSTLGLKFNWLSIGPDWHEIERALNENPIRVVVIAGGKEDLVYDCIRYAESVNPQVAILVMSATPWLLTSLIRKFPKVTFFNVSTILKDAPGFSDFALFVPKVRANL